jgi:pyruvate dehydrogenase E1 component alpha subunit
MLLIRHFERALLELFATGRLNGTTHTCLGQEHVPVTLAALLGESDYVFSNHRGHGHYLARFDDPVGLLAEILGREGAVCSGVGGSQHIARPGYISTGVQGESLPLAAGVALHLRRAAAGALSLAYIGDGTWGEGAVYEALNVASLWRLPLVVVVENNGIAQSTPLSDHMAGTIADRARAFGVEHISIDSIDVEQARERLAPCFSERRREPRPLVVEFHTIRLGPHSKGDDSREPSELAALRARDWYVCYAEALGPRMLQIEEEVAALIQRVVADVTARAPAVWEMAR